MLVEKTLVLEHQALLVRLPISPGMTTKIARYEYPYHNSGQVWKHITTWFHRLTQMSGFTTWSNSLSTGHSLSGTWVFQQSEVPCRRYYQLKKEISNTADEGANVYFKFGTFPNKWWKYSSCGDCESKISNCDGFIMRPCVPFIGSIPTQLCIGGSENHIPCYTAYKWLTCPPLPPPGIPLIEVIQGGKSLHTNSFSFHKNLVKPT